MATLLPLPAASHSGLERCCRLCATPPLCRPLSGGSRFRPRHYRERPSPRVVAAMRERAQAVDPQIKQRRERLPPGHFHYYATCHPGLEAVVAAELAGRAIGAAGVHPGEYLMTISSGLSCDNLWLQAYLTIPPGAMPSIKCRSCRGASPAPLPVRLAFAGGYYNLLLPKHVSLPRCAGKAGVSFTGDLSVGYRANMWLRAAIRVLQLLGETLLDPRRPAGEEVSTCGMLSLVASLLLAWAQRLPAEAQVSCTVAGGGGHKALSGNASFPRGLLAGLSWRAACVCDTAGQPGTQLDGVPTPASRSLAPAPRRQVYAAFREGASWPRLLAPGQTFSVESRVWSCSNLSSSQVGGSVVAVWGGPEHYPPTPIPTIPPSQRMHRCLVLQRCMATGLRAHSGVAHARRCRSPPRARSCSACAPRTRCATPSATRGAPSPCPPTPAAWQTCRFTAPPTTTG